MNELELGTAFILKTDLTKAIEEIGNKNGGILFQYAQVVNQVLDEAALKRYATSSELDNEPKLANGVAFLLKDEVNLLLDEVNTTNTTVAGITNIPVLAGNFSNDEADKIGKTISNTYKPVKSFYKGIR
jgi:hypothetical protein